MSFWYEKTIEDLDISIDKEDVHIYLGTEEDLPYPDFGAMYVSIPIKDIEKFISSIKETK